MLDKVRQFLKENKVEFFLLLSILIISAFLRLYKISDYMTFLGDEGRDAIVAREIMHGNLTLLGPRASAGDFFLGPIYYYMMAPLLFLSNYDPVGPAIMVALIGVATVFLVYFVSKDLFGLRAALIASLLYAISPLVIVYSRSSWNPNPMPFFSLLMLYLLYLGVKKNSLKFVALVGLLLGVAMQLHYLSTFLAVIIFFFIPVGNFIVSKKMFVSRTIKHYLLAAGGFFIGILPYLALEVRDGFPNTQNILKFIIADNNSKDYVPNHSFISNLWDVFTKLFGRLVTAFPSVNQLKDYDSLLLQVWIIGTVIIAISSIIFLFKTKNKLKIAFLGLWLFFGILLFGFYKKNIYDYYLGFMFPLPFILVGGLLGGMMAEKRLNRVLTILSIIILSIIVGLNLWSTPFKYPPNKQKDQAKKIAEFVLSKTDEKPYNFALITDGNSDHVYRYFFEVKNRIPITIENEANDPKRNTVTDQLLIVCEIKDCKPLGYPLWEVAGFGRAEIEGEWKVSVVKVVKLVHYREPEIKDEKSNTK